MAEPTTEKPQTRIPTTTQAAMYERRVKNLSDEMGPAPNLAGYSLGLLLALTRAH